MTGRYNEYMNYHGRIRHSNVEDSESGFRLIVRFRASQKFTRTWKRTLDEAQEKARKIKPQIRISGNGYGNTIPQTFVRPKYKVVNPPKYPH